MRDAIKNRISRRKFRTEPISPVLKNAICDDIDRLNRSSGLTVEFCQDASDAFSSMKKTYGMFSGVRSVVIMKGKKDDPFLAEKIGYYGEELVLDITDMELGTCWVAGTFDRTKFNIPDDEKMLCVIPVGYIDAVSAKEKIIRNSISRKRKPAEERLKNYGEAPEWARNAMEAVRLAPSAVNSQKPYFEYKNGFIYADVDEKTDINLIDLGIAKKHFELEAGGIFDIGSSGKFTEK